MPRMLMIDNYDSFTFNLVQLFLGLGLEVLVRRADKIAVAEAEALGVDYVVISPGPKDPRHAGVSVELIAALHQRLPILGVCLGMQCLNEAFGGRTERAPLPVHGKTSLVRHQGRGVFAGLPSPFLAARYHSLMTVPAGQALEVTAVSDDGVIMGLQHRHGLLHGVQFHPESFLTEHGRALAANFLRLGPWRDEAGHA
ncbi:glutamine amidotransferase of anthranilate synthase [Desulfarculus baarsii DSM 2075]|uniref:Glutamine amidotransferase of anthranilate synthase n=1 Tax=Desulfarculus baarsii (strain ATCC 33931 / DSM 2075 / LMG 7858 / VKM B-1802 / 2st14) TaxID=644282 RepID=E1QLV3_DESB2|nr:aminodeoxychorismate/anthranilate synthase component II [Desulfarculus baarsii]ADK86538.1 glutamine amidotransferase of anthranilate synthase [Desulfarculus baarsii DSM 2075]